MMIGDIELSIAARKMSVMLYSDSRIPIDESQPRIRSALVMDNLVPTLYEMECLIFGGPITAEVDDDHPDTGGEGNPTVEDRFPCTSDAIDSFF